MEVIIGFFFFMAIFFGPTALIATTRKGRKFIHEFCELGED